MAAHIGGKQNAARIGKADGRLFGNALDARTDGHETVDLPALTAMFGCPHLVTAMVTHEDAAKAVLDHPGGTVGALILVPAGIAERQRSIAAAIEKEQRLLAAIKS